MSQAKKTTKILLDADVIIHFIKGGQHFLLPRIYPTHELCLLDKVYPLAYKINYISSSLSKKL